MLILVSVLLGQTVNFLQGLVYLVAGHLTDVFALIIEITHPSFEIFNLGRRFPLLIMRLSYDTSRHAYESGKCCTPITQHMLVCVLHRTPARPTLALAMSAGRMLAAASSVWARLGRARV